MPIPVNPLRIAVENGLTIRQIAQHFGLKYSTTAARLQKAGLRIQVKEQTGKKVNSERDRAMVTRYKNGETLQAIGRVYGLTRERVRQILVKNNIVHRDFRKKQKDALIAEAKQRIINGEDEEAVRKEMGISKCTSLHFTRSEYRQKRLNELWRNIDVRDEGECWDWKGYVVPAGHPHANYRILGRSTRVPTLIYALTFGEPTGWVMQTCRNKRCCNPKHLKDMPPKEAIQTYRNRTPKYGDKWIADYAKEIGLSESAMSYRLLHWPLERALTEPKRSY